MSVHFWEGLGFGLVRLVCSLQRSGDNQLRFFLRYGIGEGIVTHGFPVFFCRGPLTAAFFAAAFFFLGQPQVMPAFVHGSPILFVPALAPLVLMVFWLARVRLTSWFTRTATAS